MRAKFAALAAVAGVAVAAACVAAWNRQKAADDWVLEPARTSGAGTPAGSEPKMAAIPVEPTAVEGATAEQDGADDLSAIKGIGPVYVERLDGIGVTTFDQVARWSDDEIDSVGPRIKADPNRIRREDWVGQARRLVESGRG